VAAAWFHAFGENLNCAGAVRSNPLEESHCVGDGHSGFGGDVLAQVAFWEKAFDQGSDCAASAPISVDRGFLGDW
jgi:hypothetical protein